MKFDDAREVDQICYQIKLADFPRASNRSLINNLFNGVPPFSEAEAEQNGIHINVNFLEGTKLAHDARSQFNAAFLKPGRYFNAKTDMGPKHKRDKHSAIVSRHVNRVMKRSMGYFETMRSKFALDVLHGIGPGCWRNPDKWCPDAIGIEDVGIPADTRLDMENLPFFYLYRSYTVPELMKLTRNAETNPGWNMPLVESCIRQIDTRCCALNSTNWPDYWSPEKVGERIKGDGGFYASDRVPTIDTFDFYFWHEDGKKSGWRRRIILDAWSTPTVENSGQMTRRAEMDFSKNQFLYTSKNRNYADKQSEIIGFQFADLSAVAPFRYHTVRSLGFLIYAVCNLQNRMRCKFSESVFESLMNYFRVKSSDDAERALKIELINRGFIDETVQFIPGSERWQIPAALVELGMSQNAQLIQSNSSSYTAQSGGGGGDRKTKFQVMAEQNQTVALVAAGLNQAYQYQEFEYAEIFRRFCKKDSTDPDVREFRDACLKDGVPPELLVASNWDLDPVRVMGAGNKTLEMTIAESLMQARPLYDPDSQREILHDFTLAVTDDPARADRLVPEEALKVSDTVHDAQLAMGTLMQGLPVAIKTGQNHQEYVTVCLKELAFLIDKCNKRGGMATIDQIEGFQNVAQHINQHIQVLAKDPTMKGFVAAASKELGKQMNFVKAFQQRLQEQMKKAQAAGPQGDPAAQAKIQATVMQAQTKAQLSKQSHAEKTAQKQISFEMDQRRKRQQFEQQLAMEKARTAHELNGNRLKSMGDE